MKQEVITPELKSCTCGNRPTFEIVPSRDWNMYKESYRFRCSCGRFTNRNAGNRHRAICRWNNYINLGNLTVEVIGRT